MGMEMEGRDERRRSDWKAHTHGKLGTPPHPNPLPRGGEGTASESPGWIRRLEVQSALGPAKNHFGERRAIEYGIASHIDHGWERRVGAGHCARVFGRGGGESRGAGGAQSPGTRGCAGGGISGAMQLRDAGCYATGGVAGGGV